MYQLPWNEHLTPCKPYTKQNICETIHNIPILKTAKIMNKNTSRSYCIIKQRGICLHWRLLVYMVNEQHWSAEPLAQARCVRFCFCLYKVWSCVSKALLLALRTLSLSFVTITLPQTVRLFCISLRSQVLSFSSMRRHGHSHNWPLHVHYGILHCGHTFLRCIELIYGITLWAYLSEPLVKDSDKCHRVCYVHVTERYTETLHMKKMADLVADSR